MKCNRSQKVPHRLHGAKVMRQSEVGHFNCGIRQQEIGAEKLIGRPDEVKDITRV